MINAYAAWISTYFLKAASTNEDMLMPDGMFSIAHVVELTRPLGSGIINPLLNKTFEEGRKQSEGYLAAAFNRTLLPAKRSRPPTVVVGTKKQCKASKDKELKQKSKEQATELKQAKRELLIAELTARYQRGDSIEASELAGLKRKELALILGIEKFGRRTVAQLQGMIQLNEEKNANQVAEEEAADDEEEDNEEDEEEDHAQSISNLILRLQRTPSGNHWEGGVFERSEPQEDSEDMEEGKDE